MLPNNSSDSGVMPASSLNSSSDSVPCVTASCPKPLRIFMAMMLASRAVSNRPKYWRSPPASTTSTVYLPKRDSGA